MTREARWVRRSPVLAAAVVLVALLGIGRASAKTLHAGPIQVTQDDQIVCNIVNIGNKDVTELFIEAVTEEVEVDGPYTLAPGETVSLSKTATVGSSRVSWCRFTFKGSARKVRAAACVRPSVTVSCQAAVPAH